MQSSRFMLIDLSRVYWWLFSWINQLVLGINVYGVPYKPFPRDDVWLESFSLTITSQNSILLSPTWDKGYPEPCVGPALPGNTFWSSPQRLERTKSGPSSILVLNGTRNQNRVPFTDLWTRTSVRLWFGPFSYKLIYVVPFDNTSLREISLFERRIKYGGPYTPFPRDDIWRESFSLTKTAQNSIMLSLNWGERPSRTMRGACIAQQHLL